MATLVVSREVGESLTFTIPPGETARSVRVLIGMKTKNKRVRLVIDAPDEIRIVRQDVLNREGMERAIPATEGGRK